MLKDRETGETYLEFNEQIVFQIPCAKGCTSIKSCEAEGHKLQDWSPTLAAATCKASARQRTSGGRTANTCEMPSEHVSTEHRFLHRFLSAARDCSTQSRFAGCGISYISCVQRTTVSRSNDDPFWELSSTRPYGSLLGFLSLEMMIAAV